MLTRTALILPALLLLPATAHADGPDDSVVSETSGQWDNLGYHPYVHYPQVRTVDLSAAGRAASDYVAEDQPQPKFWELDQHKLTAAEIEADEGVAGSNTFAAPKRGVSVMPEDVAKGLRQPELGPIFAVEDIPGNEYPRKHTLFLNFSGGMLYTGTDNSAENRSNLAVQGVYPVFGGGESIALSIIQAVQADVAPFGISVAFDYRPRNIVPYTMEMMGGNACDNANVDNCNSVGGVAPGADCGALGQRHVVYTFTNGGSVTRAANTASQEAGHGWGLDHTFNCSSVMSYCGSGDGSYQNSCDGLCESACQGDAGCRLTHEMFCGEGNDQQNDALELEWIFGTNEPDMEAPTVEIVEPMDGNEYEVGANVDLRAIVEDNYGGYGWKFIIKKDDEVIFDQPDYNRDVDPEYRAALNLANLEEGVYELTVEAEDQYENVTIDTVTITVGDAVAGTTDSDGTTDSGGSDTDTGDSDSDTGTTTDGGSGSDTGDSGGDTDTDSGGDSAGADGGDKGCSVGGRPQSGALGLLLLALGAVRRRRSQS